MYSNVTPPALPDTYDPTAYPNYVMVFDYSLGGTDWYQTHLYYAATAFVFDGSHITNTEGVIRKNICGSDGTWTGETVADGAPTLAPGLNGNVCQRIYTNHDILDADGNVYLAADTVTPVKVRCQRSFWTGVALALADQLLPLVAPKKLVGYSYNGTVLPELPEWDKETYPYAVMQPLGLTITKLYCSTAPIYQYDHSTLVPFDAWATTDGSYIIYDHNASSDIDPYRFILSEDAGVTHYTANSRLNRIFLIREDAVWSNYDIKYLDDGSTYLSASEPVPVYE